MSLAAISVAALILALLVSGTSSVHVGFLAIVLAWIVGVYSGLIERLGGGDTMALVSSMNVGAHLVDMSPLSTTGALCLAAASLGTDNRVLFNKLLAWGLSMTVVGALISWVFFGLL